MDNILKYFYGNSNKERENVLECGTEAMESLDVTNEASNLAAAPLSRQNVELEKEVIRLLKAKSPDIAKLKMLIEENCWLISSEDDYGNTLLHLAIAKTDNAKHADLSFISFLLEKGVDLKAKCEGGFTPFLYAAFKNKFGVIKLLAEQRENDVNAQNRVGDTALHLAVLHNHLEATIVLHKLAKTHGLREDIRNKNGPMTAIELAKSRSPANQTIIEILEDRCSAQKRMAAFHHGPSYEMTCKPRGICLVLQNEEFVGNDPEKQRAGCLDAKLIKQTFESLHFIVKTSPSLTAYEMYKVIKDYSEMDHGKYSCFALCISSHGAHGEVFGKDWKPLKVKDIIKLFTGPKCSSLAGKPKLIFINACRNDSVQNGSDKYQDEGLQEELLCGHNSFSEDDSNLGSPMDDIFEGHSSSEGFKSYRVRMDNGTCVSLYFEELCKALDEYADELEFQQIMTLVNSGVRNRGVNVPSPINRLLKSLWLSKHQ